MSTDSITVVSTDSVLAAQAAEAAKNTSTESVEDTEADKALEAKAHEGQANKGEELDDPEGADTDGGDEDGKEAAKLDENGKPKKKSGAQRQREKISRLEQELLNLKQQVQKPEPTKTEPAQAAKQTDDGKPNPDNYETIAEYTEALTDWKLDQKEKAQAAKSKEEQVKSEFQNMQSAHNKRCQAFAEKTKDFAQTMDDFKEDYIGAEVPVYLDNAVMESELGPELMYEFAKNPDEFKRICGLSYGQALKEIGKIEARLSKPSEEKTTETKVTKAPKPITPISQGSSGVGKKTIFTAESQAEYEAIRKEQLRNKSAWG